MKPSPTEQIWALRNLLRKEHGDAENERAALAVLDVPALLARAQRRREFSDELGRIVGELRRALPEPVERTPEIIEQLAEAQSLAAALAFQNQLNQQLLGRALSCVRAVLSALTPVARRYGPSTRRPSYSHVTAHIDHVEGRSRRS